MIGWWKNSKLKGNCRVYFNSTLTKAGWYQDGEYQEEYRISNSTGHKYKYWDMKDKYFLDLSKVKKQPIEPNDDSLGTSSPSDAQQPKQMNAAAGAPVQNIIHSINIQLR